MKIKSVEARNISIPLNRPIHNPAFKFTHCKYTIVTVTTDEGITGWCWMRRLWSAISRNR